MFYEELLLPVVVISFIVAALVTLLWRPIAKQRAKKTSQWRTDFDGITPKIATPSAREARQVYRELQAIDKTNPKILEDVGSQALKELQQIVDEHHKKK